MLQVVAAILERAGRILICRRRPDQLHPLKWEFPGGKVEAGEAPAQALERELEEELGLTAGRVRYFTEFSFDFSFCGHGRLIRRFFEVPVERRTLDHLTLREGAKMKLFTAREILTGTRIVPFDAFALWLHAARRAFGDKPLLYPSNSFTN